LFQLHSQLTEALRLRAVNGLVQALQRFRQKSLGRHLGASFGFDRQLARDGFERRRVQMALSSNSFDRLNRLKDMSEASTYTEVMKDALRLYEFFLEQDLIFLLVLVREERAG
jgi:hypothetical protein